MSREFANVGFQSVAGLPGNLERLLERALAGRKSILDYGCGYGGWLAHFLRINPSCNYSAFDIDKTAERHARELAAHRLSETTQSFDFISCFAVLELLDPQRQLELLDELSRKLSPGGVLAIQYNVFNFLAPRWLLFALLSMGRPKRFHDRHRFRRSYLSERDVRQLFSEAGLEVIDVAVGRLHPAVPTSIEATLGKLRIANAMHSQFFYILRKAEAS